MAKSPPERYQMNGTMASQINHCSLQLSLASSKSRTRFWMTCKTLHVKAKVIGIANLAVNLLGYELAVAGIRHEEGRVGVLFRRLRAEAGFVAVTPRLLIAFVVFIIPIFIFIIVVKISSGFGPKGTSAGVCIGVNVFQGLLIVIKLLFKSTFWDG
ncbi:uncharacterized protein LY79DRAFT_140819 [Colletotrichum navitas]|uniref:Uncharacterized protein n=1 Tax=Colletotrichum navitas TaxID=681940 RepID=A0AAD8VAP7_9PEZI|nr:uncharacterized protein LY79DRAFT_140819 [Colletotrichum navitas]KAK1599434.1 hypothetical protein LY79DRAFT_140819 [Colletotrichum navitas]